MCVCVCVCVYVCVCACACACVCESMTNKSFTLLAQFLAPFSASFNIVLYMVFTIKFSVLIILIQSLIILTCLHMYKGYIPNSPYTDALKVVVFTFNILFKNLRCILSISLDLENPHISHA